MKGERNDSDSPFCIDSDMYPKRSNWKPNIRYFWSVIVPDTEQELRSWCFLVLAAKQRKNIAQIVSSWHDEGYDTLSHPELTVRAMFLRCFAAKNTDFSFQLRNS